MSQFTAALSLIPVRVSLPAFAYAIFPPDKLPACPAQADVDAYLNDEGPTVEPPTVSDECLASVMVLMTSMAGAASSNYGHPTERHLRDSVASDSGYASRALSRSAE